METDTDLALTETFPELVPTTEHLSDSHPAAVYLGSLSKGSQPAQRSALKKIANLVGRDIDTMPWESLRYQHVQFIRARLSERYSAVTANRFLTALRCVLKEAWRLGYIPEPDYRMAIDVKPIRTSNDNVEDALSGRRLSQGELSALMDACESDETIAGVRDASILSMAYQVCVRRAEIANLELSDYNRQDGTIRIVGKGNKIRVEPVTNGAQVALEDWLKVRGETEPGKLYWGVDKSGKLSTHSLNVVSIDQLFDKRSRQAGIDDTSFHDMRRTTITDLLDLGVDLVTVSKIAGHSDPRTTARYDRRGMETRRDALSSLHMPYKSRFGKGKNKRETKTK